MNFKLYVVIYAFITLIVATIYFYHYKGNEISFIKPLQRVITEKVTTIEVIDSLYNQTDSTLYIRFVSGKEIYDHPLFHKFMQKGDTIRFIE